MARAASLTHMRSAVARLWLLYHTPQGKKLVRYGMVSAVSAVISFTILTVVYGVLQLWTEVPSALFSNILATFPNYFLNRRWVWGKSGKSHFWKEVVPFWVMSITGIVLALLTASLARQFSNSHDLSHVARTVVIVGANSAAFGILWVLKFMILNRLFQSFPDTESGVGTESSPVARIGSDDLRSSPPKAGVTRGGPTEPSLPPIGEEPTTPLG